MGCGELGVPEKQLALLPQGGAVPIGVETRLADPDDFGVRHERGELAARCWGGAVGVVGVVAERDPDVGVAFGELERALGVLEVGADGDQRAQLR